MSEIAVTLRISAQRQEMHPNQGRSKLSKNSFLRFRSSLLLTGIFLSNSARRWKNTHPQTIRKRIHIATKIQQENGANGRMECDERKDCGGQSVQPSGNPLNQRFAFALHGAPILRSPFPGTQLLKTTRFRSEVLRAIMGIYHSLSGLTQAMSSARSLTLHSHSLFLNIVRLKFAIAVELNDHGTILRRNKMRYAGRDDDKTSRGVPFQI